MKVKAISLLIFFASLLPAAVDYRVSYFFSGQAQGKILLIIPYRVYFQASAGLTFSAGPEAEGLTRFSAGSISGPALLIRTLGYKGRHLAVLLGNNDGHREIADLELGLWQKAQPDFARFVRNPFFLFFFPEIDPESPPYFLRSGDGRHPEAGGLVRLQPYRPGQDDQVESNFFPMLLAALKLYNHSFRPPENENGAAGWWSDDIDLSAPLGELSAQTANIVARLVKVQQEKPFRLRYLLETGENGVSVYRGQARPEVRIWKEFAINSMTRSVTIANEGGRLLTDEIELEMSNQKKIAGRGRVSLQRLNRQREIE